MLTILADKNIYKLSSFLPQDITINYFDPNLPLPSLNGVDALLVRTVTTLNAETIGEFPDSVKLIGTASSGSDHIDAEYFINNGVHVIDAIGCNANAVSEYVVTSLLLWSIERKEIIQNLKVGIIGAGATGTAVSKQLAKFDIPFCMYDPPRENRDSFFASATLSEILNCDILTFHVPLIKNGAYSTFHWLDHEKLSNNNFELIINASRGGVINELDLLKYMHSNTVKDIVIDVWEAEPDFNVLVMEKAFIATPHIAGYSEQAKLNASKFLADKMARYFNFTLPNSDQLYEPKTMAFANLDFSLKDLCLKLNPLKDYDNALRNLVLQPNKEDLFLKLRSEIPFRYEYPFLKVSSNDQAEFNTLIKLGIQF